MTHQKNCDTSTASPAQASLSCLVDTPELLRVRILPAEFSRLIGVSKQTVSRWIDAGKVSINPVDGRLDMQRAVQEVLRNTDPGKLRARVLRAAINDVSELRIAAATADERVAAVEATLREAESLIAHLERWNADGDAHAETFRALLIEHAEELRAAPPEAWEKTLSDLSDAAWDVVDPLDAADALDAVRAIHETEGGGGDALAYPEATTITPPPKGIKNDPA